MNVIAPTQPIFQSVLGDDWEALPPVMQAHYAVRPYSNDRVTVRGTLDIRISCVCQPDGKSNGYATPLFRR